MAAPPYLRMTMDWFRDLGYEVAKTEVWVPRRAYRRASGEMVTPGVAGVRRDLWGWIDCLAYRAGEGIVGIQATSRASLSAHRAKMRSDEIRPHVLGWIAAGGRAFLVGWHHPRPRTRWVPEYEEILPGWLEP